MGRKECPWFNATSFVQVPTPDVQPPATPAFRAFQEINPFRQILANANERMTDDTVDLPPNLTFGSPNMYPPKKR